MKKIKVLAMYLPQFHRTPENDRFWGSGYTDWTAVRNAKPVFKGHNQPRVPLDGYYDLSTKKDIEKQIELANKYGIYGFGIYHYWFSSSQVFLDTPAKIIRDQKLPIKYFFSWDNSSWKRSWSNVKFANDWTSIREKRGGPAILAELKYGDETEWRKHFNYLLHFFKDSNYIKVNNKPLFGIFNPDNDEETLSKMIKCWNAWAIEEGFAGICTLGKIGIHQTKLCDYQFEYEPAQHGWLGGNCISYFFCRARDKIRLKCGLLRKFSYDLVWKSIIKGFKKKERYWPCCFVRYDDSPRRGKKGAIVIGESPEKFKKYLKKYICKCEKSNKDYLLVTAWNEWGEGAYLEPDTETSFGYLEAIKSILDE